MMPWNMELSLDPEYTVSGGTPQSARLHAATTATNIITKLSHAKIKLNVADALKTTEQTNAKPQRVPSNAQIVMEIIQLETESVPHNTENSNVWKIREMQCLSIIEDDASTRRATNTAEQYT